MKKSNLLIGLTIGVIGCKHYSSIKKILKPGLVKVLKSAILIEENTKCFFKEATETAIKLNKKNYRIINEDSIKDKESNITENINNLKRQLTEIQQQLSML